MKRIVPIHGLSLITSCGCNLKCDYCYISQSVNTSQSTLQKNTIQALKDGSFLENIKKIFYKLDIMPYDIHYLTLWGQEPTLTLKFLNEHLDDWFRYLNNIHHIEFCSNGMAFLDEIYTFIKKVDELTPFDNTTIAIQFSYDGKYSTNNFRHGDSEKIFNNIKKLIEQLNTLKLRNTKVTFTFHGVMSFQLLEKLNDKENIEEYYKDLDNFAFQLSDISLNKNVTIAESVGLCIEGPHKSSYYDGMLFTDFVKKSLRLDLTKFHEKHNRGLDVLGPLHHFIMLLDRFNAKDPCELMEKVTRDKNLYKDVLKSFSQAMYCGVGYNELKVMYDGTLVNCQNSIYETNDEYVPDNGSIENLVKRSLIQHNYFLNPINASQEQIDNYFDLFQTQKESSYFFIFTEILNLIYYLAKSKQIDIKYLVDEKELYKAAFICTVLYCCAYNNLILSGSAFMVHSSFLRTYCNGILDFADLATGGKI